MAVFSFKMFYVLMVSSMAVPAIYSIEMYQGFLDPLKASGVCLATMLAVVVLAAIAKPRTLHGSSFWYFAFFWGAFSAVGEITLALEIYGHIQGIASYWPKNVEPYLLTSHGAAFLLVDGILQLVSSVLALSAMFDERSFRGVGLFWAGSMLNGFAVFLSFVIIDGYPLNVAILLNVPYVVAAGMYLWNHLPGRSTPSSPKARTSTLQPNTYSILSRMLFPLVNTALVSFIGVRALAAASSDLTAVHVLKTQLEPAIGELVTAHVVQLLIYVFYLAPFFVLASLHLVLSSESVAWLSDWARVFAGVVINGQAVFLLAQFRPITDDALPPLPDSTGFYSAHIAFALFPLLFLIVDNHKPKPRPIDYKKIA